MNVHHLHMNYMCLFLFFLLALVIIGCEESESPVIIVEPRPNPNPTPEPTNGNEAEDIVVNEGLQVGDRVKVTNTGIKGLRIRNPPGVEQIEDNIIGNAGEGSTGIILEGPALGDGYTWWRIEWDDNDKIRFEEGEPCCKGWSAETNKASDIRYLTEIK